MERTFAHEIPDIVVKLPLTISFIAEPSGAEKLGRARLWDMYGDRFWRKFSPGRYQARVTARIQDFTNRMRAGDTAVVATLEGELIGAGWFSLKEVRGDLFLGSSYALKPGEAYIYQGLVDKSLRGNRINPKRLTEVLKHLKAIGVTKVIAIIEEDNYSSIAVVKRLGFKPVRLISIRRLFSRVRRYETILNTSD